MIPVLQITGGIARKTAEDVETGASFIEFEVDPFADESVGICVHCDKPVHQGWLCLDGGEEWCYDCVCIVCEMEVS